jgi:transposase
MPAKKISMRKINDVLRLSWGCQQSQRQVALQCNISRPCVAEYLRRASDAGLSWPLPPELTDTQLDRLLFPPPPKLDAELRGVPDWAKVYEELRKKSVTKFLLWQEYRELNPKGYNYSWFCDQYRRWLGKRDISMRQHHRAGEKLFVDYGGHTIPIVDARTGEQTQAQIFVAVLGASNYTFAEATATQSLPDWIGSHVRAFEYLGAVPEILVPDNLKSGVTKAHRYEPDLNPTYQDMAQHYNVVVIPARVRRPKDKPKVELGVQIVSRWILAALRNHTFFSLQQLNTRISELLVGLNDRPFRKLPGCRRSRFETLDRPALKPLPANAYIFAEWGKARVNIDYHVEVDRHYYSVPNAYRKKQVDVRYTENTVECFYDSQRIASHTRSRMIGHHTTVREHMPESHRQYGDWSPERLICWAHKYGKCTAELVNQIMQSRRHPEQGYRSCLGILRLEKTYGAQRLEAACQRTLLLGTLRYKSVESILKHGLDQIDPVSEEEQVLPNDHDNIRGPSYYH